MGFFVTTMGARTNTYFVTALHCLTAIREKEKSESFSLRVAVKKRDSAQSTELVLPCNEATLTGLPVDIAAIRICDGQLNRQDIDVNPIELRFPEAMTKKKLDGSPPQEEMPDQAGYVIAEQLWALRKEDSNSMSAEETLRAINICSGKPGFLLYHSRTNLNVRMGSEVFALVSHTCIDDTLARAYFPIFFRKGVLSYLPEDFSLYEPMSLYGGKYNYLMIDCQSSKGNSGAPVFLPVKETFRGGHVCETPHLLGILVRVITAKGDAQKLDLPIMKDGREDARIKGEHVFEENAGLSWVVPVDYLALLLMENERRR